MQHDPVAAYLLLTEIEYAGKRYYRCDCGGWSRNTQTSTELCKAHRALNRKLLAAAEARRDGVSAAGS